LQSSMFPTLSLYGPVDDDEDDEEEDDDDEAAAAGRLLRRCWLRGMPRCTDL
jgi:hypothetical protein